MITLKNATIDLLPATNIHMLEDRFQSTAKVEENIYGSPVVITKELPSSKLSWTIGAAYVSLAVAQACIDAYHQNTHLTLTDERSNVYTVVINEYPSLDRHQSLDQLIYSVKLTLVQDAGTFGLPSVLSTSGPRLFGR